MDLQNTNHLCACTREEVDDEAVGGAKDCVEAQSRASFLVLNLLVAFREATDQVGADSVRV